MVINIKIEKRIATYVRSDEIPVCGSNLDTVKFEFDGEWEQYQDKFARFIYGTYHHDEPIKGDTCKVPMFINVKTVLIGVIVGEPGADEDCIATTMAEVEFKPSARCTNTAPSAGTIQNYTSEAQEYAAEARVAANDAEEWAVISKNAANRATDSAAYVEDVVNDAKTELAPQVDQNTLAISDNREDIDINRKRIINLEQGLPAELFETDSTVAYTKVVPANATPYAEIKRIGGITHRDLETETLKSTKVTSIVSRGADGETTLDNFSIPEAAFSLEEYGLGVDAEYCNYIDWEKKQYVRRVYKYAVTGREGEEGGGLSKWSVAFVFVEGAGGKLNKFSIRLYPEDGFLKSVNSQATINLASNHYTPTIRTVVYNQDTDGVVSAFAHSQGYTLIEIAVRDISTKEAMIQQLKDWYDSGNPLTIVYKLEEPIATPIGDLLPEDNFIKVEGGGTITAVNEDDLGAAIGIEYMLKEGTV